MGQTTRKQIIFDIDTKVASAILGESKYRKLYSDIERYMKKNGFKHIEGSSYESIHPITRTKVAYMIEKLISKYPYLSKCVRDTRETSITEGRSLNKLFDYDGTPGKFVQYDYKQNNSKSSMLHKLEEKKAEAKKKDSDRQSVKNKEQSHNKSSR